MVYSILGCEPGNARVSVGANPDAALRRVQHSVGQEVGPAIVVIDCERGTILLGTKDLANVAILKRGLDGVLDEIAVLYCLGSVPIGRNCPVPEFVLEDGAEARQDGSTGSNPFGWGRVTSHSRKSILASQVDACVLVEGMPMRVVNHLIRGVGNGKSSELRVGLYIFQLYELKDGRTVAILSDVALRWPAFKKWSRLPTPYCPDDIYGSGGVLRKAYLFDTQGSLDLEKPPWSGLKVSSQ
jgi:hypothetical protein